MLTIDPNKPAVRKHRYYSCVRCGVINNEYEIFAAGSLDKPKYYCLGHIPLLSKIKLRWSSA